MTDHIERAIRRRYQPSVSAEAFLDKVRARARTLEAEAVMSDPQTRRTRGVSIRYLGWGIAGVGLAAAVFFATGQLSSGHVVQTTQEYATVRGQMATVTLSDGSTITLAPSTRLRYAIDHASGSAHGDQRIRGRTVTLDGEAYFSVRHADDAPFRVAAGDVVTTVLGTEFGVRKYADDERTRVSVVSGKVSSSYAGHSVVLTERMLALLGDSSVQTATVPDMKSYTGWVDGTLVFENVPADSMLTTLNRWYGYRFHLADSALGKRRVTAAFDVRTPSQVLTALGILLDVQIAVRDSVVTLIPGRGNQRHQPPARRHGGDDIPILMEVGR